MPKKEDYIPPDRGSLDEAIEAIRALTKAKYNLQMEKVPYNYIREWVIPVVLEAFPGRWDEKEVYDEFAIMRGHKERPNRELFGG